MNKLMLVGGVALFSVLAIAVEQSWAEAAKWFRRAVQNGYELSDEERKIADEY